MKKRIRIATALAAAVFFLLLVWGRSTRPVSQVRLWTIQAFSSLARAGAHTAGYLTGVPEEEVRVLQENSRRLSTAEGQRMALEKENESLRRLLGLTEGGGTEGMVAGVLSYTHAMGTETLVINAGSDRGIVAGNIVIDENRLLVGHISEASADVATVSVASNAGSAFSGLLLPVGGKVLIKGIGGRTLALELIPYDVSLRDGDMVLWASESRRAGADIFAGRVVKGGTVSAGAFKTGRAVLLADPDALDHVLIITGP